MKEGDNREGKKILTNSWWLFFDKIIRQGLNFLLTAYIARYLGASAFGEWNYAIALVVLFSFFSTFGLYNILLRDFVRHPDQGGEIMGSALFLRFVGGGLTLLFSAATVYILKPGSGTLQILTLVTAANYLAQTTDVVDYYFQSQLRANWIAMARGIAFVIFAVAKLLFIHFQFGVLSFALAQAGEFALSGGLLFLFLKKEFLSSVRISITRLKRLLHDCLPIAFSEIAILIYMRTDQVMIGEMMGNHALGNYSAAVKLSEIWYFIPGIVCSSVFPSIVRAHQENSERYREKLQQLYDLLACISIGIGVVVSLASYWIVAILFGPDFADASSVLVIHVWAGVFVFWGLASNQQLVIEHLTKISLYRTLVGMAVNVLLNFLLIPRMGIAGAAIATLIAQAFSAWIGNLFFRQSRDIFWMNLRSLNLLRSFRSVAAQFKHEWS